MAGRFERVFKHVVVLGLTLCAAGGASAAEGLLTPAATALSEAKREQLRADPHVIRWRVAQWDANAVFDANATFAIPPADSQETPAPEAAAPLVLNLFDDVAVKAHVRSAKTLESGSRFLFGALEDGGYFTLFRHGSGIVRGEVHSTDGGYFLHSDGTSDRILVMQADLSKLAGYGRHRHEHDAEAVSTAPVAPVAELDIHWRADWKATRGTESYKTIDMLVPYTQEAEDISGGPDNMRASAEYDVAYTNQVLENSGLAHRQIRLAGLVNVADRDPSLVDYYYEEEGDEEKENRLENLLTSLQEEYQADLISLYLTRIPSPVTGFAGSFFNGFYHWRILAKCARSPNPALCYYNGRRSRYYESKRNWATVEASEHLGSGRTFAHEWGHQMTISHDRSVYNGRSMAYGHTYAHYLPEQDFPEWCQGTVMSYFFPCTDERLHPTYPRQFGVPNFSNPDVFYPRRKGMDPSHPDVPMGVPGDEPTTSLFGPANAARVIDELWDIVANLSEPPFERLAGACNEGDMAANVLTSRLPARAAVTFVGGGRTYRLPVSGPTACLDDVSLKGRSSNVAFDVATDRSGGEHRLSVVATEPAHFGACVSSKRAVVTAELWDAVEEFPPEVIRQRVPGVSPGHLLVEQRSAHSFCKGAADRHHLRRLGDFDGDGRADALLRHADGHWHFYPLDENAAVSGPASRVTRNPTVAVAGVGDFNGDGQDDLLMRRAKGSWYHYPMNNGRVSGTGQGEVALPHDLGWAVEGIGDNNGDLRDDVLLRHVDGRLQWHHMDGGTVLDVGTSFRLEEYDDRDQVGWVGGVGDFSGDGSGEEILWRRTDGTWHWFPYYNRSRHGEVPLPDDLSWAVAGVADFNGDGKDDVLLRHADGRWRYYAMDGPAVVETAVPALPADPLVWLAGVGDTDGDRKADVLTRRAHGAWRVYRMDGGRVVREAEVGLAGESGWGVLTGGAVAPVETAAAVPPQPLALGADTALDLSAHFADDQALSYEVHSSDVDVVRVSVTGDVLTLMTVAFGHATVTVTARDPDGNIAVQSFSVIVSEDGTDDGAVAEAARGSAFRDCAECPEMVVAPAGWFMMGAPTDEAGSDATERPRHRVDFAAPFAIGAHEVTIGLWDACVEAGGCGGYRVSHGLASLTTYERSAWGRPWLNNEEQLAGPIAYVNWHDAVAFADWLSVHTGQAYRLPSEAEWEYAARAGTKTPYHFGKTLEGQANYTSTEVETSLGRRQSKPSLAPVGWFAPNYWGLHDVHGNIGEWTQDCWNTSYVGAPTDGGVWEAGDCARRVVRGGHWLDADPLALRSASRRAQLASANPREFFLYRITHGEPTIGFRVARSLSPLEAVATRIPAQTLSLGTDVTLDLAAHFRYDRTLSYEVRSSDAEVVSASVVGSMLTLSPIATGGATVTVTASDLVGNTATLWFSVQVWLRDCPECPAMVMVPAGTFTMGAPESEYRSQDNERPQRTVSIPAFAAGAFEVTFAEWNACVADGGCDGYRPDDEGWGFGQRPVINVRWYDAQRYVEWLSQRTGYRYRLLTESEWEYATRAGTETPFHTGETITPQQANFNGTWGYPGDDLIRGLYRQQTVPVGSFAPNAFGLHDVHGNVWEWVQDCYGSYETAPVDGSAVEEGVNCYYRVVRGGGWLQFPWDVRSAPRSGPPSDSANREVGFRVARAL